MSSGGNLDRVGAQTQDPSDEFEIHRKGNIQQAIAYVLMNLKPLRHRITVDQHLRLQTTLIAILSSSTSLSPATSFCLSAMT